MYNYMGEIEVNPKIMFGKPVIKGTRITVELILEEMSAGKLVKDLIAAHSRLTENSIWAAVNFAENG